MQNLTKKYLTKVMILFLRFLLPPFNVDCEVSDSCSFCWIHSCSKISDDKQQWREETLVWGGQDDEYCFQ